MRHLKTPEEIYLETLYKDRGIPSDSPLANKWMGDFRKSIEYRDTIKSIEAAQRDALECVKEEFKTINNDLIVLQGYSSDLNVVTAFHKFKAFLSNLLPKEK